MANLPDKHEIAALRAKVSSLEAQLRATKRFYQKDCEALGVMLTQRSLELIKLRHAAQDVVTAWADLNDPNIRVGPVHPTIERMKELVMPDD